MYLQKFVWVFPPEELLINRKGEGVSSDKKDMVNVIVKCIHIQNKYYNYQGLTRKGISRLWVYIIMKMSGASRVW